MMIGMMTMMASLWWHDDNVDGEEEKKGFEDKYIYEEQ